MLRYVILYNTDNIKYLESNFKRLESLYHEALEAANREKAENDARMMKANDDYARVVAKNEALEERVDILYKLSKSYLENNRENIARNNPSLAVSQPTANVVEFDDNTSNTDREGTWTREKLRGFRKTNLPKTNVTNRETSSNNTVVPSDQSLSLNQTDSDIRTTNVVNPERNSDRICYYFANTPTQK